MTDQALAVSDGSYDTMALMPRNMQQAKEFADQLSKSSLIPKHLQGKPGDCLMVTMQAYRWRMDPFVVANCTSVVHGRMMYEGKLVYAALISMGSIEGRLKFEFKGEGQGMSITVTGTPKGGEAVSLSGSVQSWRTRTYKEDNGQRREIPNNWDKDPQSQLVYRGTRQWARVFSPEGFLGIYTPEDDFDDSEPIPVTATLVPQIKETPAKGGPAATPAPTSAKATDAPAAKPAPAPAAAKPAPAAPAKPQAPPAPAPAPTQPEELFDDPAAAQAFDAEAEAALAQGLDETPDYNDPGEALTEAMGRVIEAARVNTKGKITTEALASKFPKGIGKGNINEALAWLRGKA